MNFLRKASTLPNVNLTSHCLRLSTATVTKPIPEETKPLPKQENEPDKLYKTVELECRANEPSVLRSFTKFAMTTGQHLGIECKSWSLRKPHHDRFSLLKCVHIYKKHQVQYELRTYFAFVQYKRLTGSTADTLLEYIQRNLPEGVALKTTKMEIQAYPEHLNIAPKSAEKLEISNASLREL